MDQWLIFCYLKDLKSLADEAAQPSMAIEKLDSR
jgi:hypothetical protein